ADVADLIWRHTRPRDEANHFADMDEANPSGETLLSLWLNEPASRTPQRWTAFYDSLPKNVENRHRGALPFRVREMYEAMVRFVCGGSLAEFICAAGTMAHYVGDACQPLHVSRFHHGHPGQNQSAVHGFYETTMVEGVRADLIAGVNNRLAGVLVTAHVS